MPGQQPPRVAYRNRTKDGDKIRVGYLVMLRGVPHLAATLEDVRQNVALARLPQLDPSLLQERPSNGDGEPEYLYSGEVPSLYQE